MSKIYRNGYYYSGGGAVWGDIAGSLSNQIDLSEALDDKVDRSDIVDNLDSTDSTKALSAKQGSNLVSYIDDSITYTLDYVVQQDENEYNGRVAGDNLRYTKTESDARYVQVETGKGLSTEDYTSAEKTKLTGIAEQATKVQDNHNTVNGTILINGTSTTVYDDTDIKQTLAGFNKNYVIDSEDDITGTKDPDTNIWTNVTAIGDLDMFALKVGDNIYIKDDSVPDYWITSAVSSVVGLDPLDTKTDLSDYYNKTETNNLLNTKVDKTTTVNGHALSGNVSVTKSDVGLGSVVNTGDSATPTSGGTTKFTTGGAYTELAKKQNTITGGATTIATSNLTASRALVSDSSGKVAVSAVTSTELGYIDGVTSNVQTQLNAKQATLIGSGTGQNVKTVNSNNIVGTGNVSVGTITGVNVNGTSVATSGAASINTSIGYYTCDTAAATAAKIGTYVSGAKYTSSYLPTGAMAVVKFTNSNSASSPL